MTTTHYYLNVTLTFENCTNFSPCNSDASFSSEDYRFHIQVKCRECQHQCPFYLVGVHEWYRSIYQKCYLCGGVSGSFSIIKAATRIPRNPDPLDDTVTKPLLHFVCTGNIEPHGFHFGRKTDYQVRPMQDPNGCSLGRFRLFSPWHPDRNMSPPLDIPGHVIRRSFPPHNRSRGLVAFLKVEGYEFQRFENIPDVNEWPY